jgi:hypothetical protein
MARQLRDSKRKLLIILTVKVGIAPTCGLMRAEHLGQ